MSGGIRLDQDSEQLQAIVRMARDLDAQESRYGNAGNRVAPTLHIEHSELGAEMAITHPGGGRVTTSVHVRALWQNGVALIHRSFLHGDTKCEISLTSRLMRKEQICAKVAACRFLSGNLHDVRLQFDRAIELSDFVKDQVEVARVSADEFQRKELAGTVVYLDPIEAEHHLFEYYLRGTKLKVVGFVQLGRAMDYLRQNTTNMFVCELDIEEVPGEEAIQTARKADYKGGILALTSDPSRAEQCRDAGANAVLTKPYTRDTLMASMRAVNAQAESGKIRSDISSDAAASIALQSYHKFLHKSIACIKALIQQEDIAALRTEILRLRGSGTSFGYKLLTVTANDAVTKLDQTFSIEESRLEIDRLQDLVTKILAGGPASV